jgi:imidazolonepropionase-like amidohydrolase
MARGYSQSKSEAGSERWDKDIHPSNRFEARWAHPWWDVQSFQKNPGYQANKAAAEKFSEEVRNKWLPMFREKGWIKPGDTQIEDKLNEYEEASAAHAEYVKKVNGLGDYLAVPISREDKIEKYLPLMKEGGAGIDKMMKAVRDIRHSMVITAADSEVKKSIKAVDLVNKQPDPEAELYKSMTVEANKVPEPIRREQESKTARWNRDHKRSRSKESE